jgi:hypothetical protein
MVEYLLENDDSDVVILDRLDVSWNLNPLSSLWDCTSGKTWTVLTYKNVPALNNIHRPVESEVTKFNELCYKKLNWILSIIKK